MGTLPIPQPTQSATPVVPKEEAQRFAQTWAKNGIIVNLDDVTIQFATDFANVVLSSFFHNIVPQIVVNTINQMAQAKPAVTLEG